jgi:acyl carrier protein
MRRQGALADAFFERMLAHRDGLEQIDQAQGYEADWRAGLQALPARRRVAALTSRLQQELGRVLGMPEGERPPARAGFFDLGLDSLMSVELKNRLERGLGIALTPTALFQHPNLQALAQHLVDAHLFPAPEEQDADNGRTRHLETVGDGAGGGRRADAAAKVEDAIASELAALDRLLKQG